MRIFNPGELKKLYRPPTDSSGEDNGSVVIIGGSHLFHGAPLLALKVASKFVDMVFFASPDPSVGEVAARVKSALFSFIWVPWEETDDYIKKADAVLIGPGLMRFNKENQKSKVKDQNWCDGACQRTREITHGFLEKYKDKKWVIDAGSLQTMDSDWIPEGAIITPNLKEFKGLFRTEGNEETVKEMARKYKCIIVLKGVETIVASPGDSVVVKGGNAGLTKGGTGDTQAGLTVALLAKNDSFLAASAASYFVKTAADELYKKVGTNYSADDLVNMVCAFK